MRKSANKTLFKYIDIYYNRIRRHSNKNGLV
ncbi:hypothetical protein [Gilliamella sp. WF3-4]